MMAAHAHADLQTLSDLFVRAQESPLAAAADLSPHLDSAAGRVRRPLREFLAGHERRTAELAELLESLGQSPPFVPPSNEAQYLGYLSLTFMLPRLVEAASQLAAQYERAASAVTDSDIRAVLNRHTDELRGHLRLLAVAGHGDGGPAKGVPPAGR